MSLTPVIMVVLRSRDSTESDTNWDESEVTIWLEHSRTQVLDVTHTHESPVSRHESAILDAKVGRLHSDFEERLFQIVRSIRGFQPTGACC
jgi:hypothetical protein